jgi:CoA-dependent NAD(P)H sulfur oxidoreductase
MLGEEGVCGRIDVFATALFARMGVDEVHHLDLAYAPPFGPVYDAILDICGKASLEL